MMSKLTLTDVNALKAFTFKLVKFTLFPAGF